MIDTDKIKEKLQEVKETANSRSKGAVLDIKHAKAYEWIQALTWCLKQDKKQSIRGKQ